MTAASDLIEVLKALPAILWVGVAVLVVVLFRKPILARLPALSSIELPGGVKAQFDAAISEASASRNETLPPDRRSRLERRIERDADVLRAARLLWVDDDHRTTEPERAALAALGVMVETVASSDAAYERLDQSRFDAALSDMARGADNEAGAVFAKILHGRHPSIPVILYVGRVDESRGTPPFVFGIADRPDQLIHLVIDALERRRG